MIFGGPAFATYRAMAKRLTKRLPGLEPASPAPGVATGEFVKIRDSSVHGQGRTV
ncbi:hypothetical protein [Streptomyces sp. NPDC017448]|uniref:hypothetical protein n=1 Tax=Streptomyces sp. NPDC017448 TaxID=3364996 RepID=UPI0037A0CC4A